MSAVSEAAHRIRDALADRPRGHRGPQGEQLHVELLASDILLCADAVGSSTDIVAALSAGVRKARPDLNPRLTVTIQADDAYHLADQADPPPPATTTTSAPKSTVTPANPPASASSGSSASAPSGPAPAKS